MIILFELITIKYSILLTVRTIYQLKRQHFRKKNKNQTTVNQCLNIKMQEYTLR